MRFLFEPLAGAMGLGGITRCLALAQAASLRGHAVAFHSQPYPLLQQYPIGPRYEAVIPTRPRPITDPQSSSFNEALSLRGVNDPAYLRDAVAGELKTVEAFRPDVMVTEWQPSVPIAAAVAGIPFVATLATTELSALVGEPVREDDPFASVNRDVLGVAAEHGLEGLAGLESVDQLLHTRSLLNIAPTVPELEPLLAAVPNTRFVGPLLFPPLELRAPDIPVRDEAPKKILVYLGAGAVSVPDMIEVLAEAFPEPDFEVLIAARETEIDGRALPFRLRSVVIAHEPGLTAALRGCDAAVLRGSQNAVAACLLAGVPVVGLPGDRDSEPRYNMRVLEAHRCGTMLEGNPSPATIAEATRRVMTDGSSARAAGLGELLRGPGGCTAAIQAIEERLAA